MTRLRFEHGNVLTQCHTHTHTHIPMKIHTTISYIKIGLVVHHCDMFELTVVRLDGCQAACGCRTKLLLRMVRFPGEPSKSLKELVTVEVW